MGCAQSPIHINRTLNCVARFTVKFPLCFAVGECSPFGFRRIQFNRCECFQLSLCVTVYFASPLRNFVYRMRARVCVRVFSNFSNEWAAAAVKLSIVTLTRDKKKRYAVYLTVSGRYSNKHVEYGTYVSPFTVSIRKLPFSALEQTNSLPAMRITLLDAVDLRLPQISHVNNFAQ